jgi:hypothetical protein
VSTVISINRRRRVFVGRQYPAGVVAKLCPNRIAVIKCAFCNQHKKVDARNLRRLKSCGCRKSVSIAAARTIHGANRRGKRTPEYRAWVGMHERCNNPRHKKFHLWGGRGIKVAPRWDSFERFLEDIGPKPEPKRLYSIDRVNTNGDYAPNNCRWADAHTQRMNQRAMIARKAA